MYKNLGLLAGLLIALDVHGAIVTLEPFDSGTSGWTDRDAGEMTVSYDASFGSLAGSLRGTFATQALLFTETDAFRATTTSSSGSFVGNYASATGYTGFVFDFYAADVLPSDLMLRFNGAGSTFFVSVLPQVVVPGQWQTVQVPLGYDFGWVGGSTAAFSNALSSANWVDVQITRSGSAQQSYFIDNFALTSGALLSVPEPGTGVLALGGFVLIMARRRIRKAMYGVTAPAKPVRGLQA